MRILLSTVMAYGLCMTVSLLIDNLSSDDEGIAQ